MFQNLIQRLTRRPDKPDGVSCEELETIIGYMKSGDYELAVEFMIFTAHFDPARAEKYLVSHAPESCKFAKLEEQFLEFINSENTKAYLADRIYCECELRERVVDLTALLHQASEVHA